MRLVYNDSSHSYWLDGRRVSGMTTVAKIGDDSFALDNWRKRQVAIGMAIRPDLAEQVAAHFDDKDKVDKLVEEAMQVAQSHVAAALGTAGHRIAERIDLGEDIIDTPLSLAIRAAWTSALERAGLTILPLYVERFVVWPDEGICGRLDRIVQDVDEELFILDAKFGATVRKYPRPCAIQLAGYGYAPWMAGEMKPSGKNGSIATEEFIDMRTLNINREKAYVLHAAEVMDTGTAEVLEVDIAEGYKALTTVVFPALKWRKVIPERLMRPIASMPIAGPELRSLSAEPAEPASDEAFDRVNGEPSSTPSSEPDTSSTTEPSSTSATLDTTGTSTATTSKTSVGTQRRSQILARLTALPEAQKARIKEHWPHIRHGGGARKPIPSLKSSHEHTDAELDAIEAAIQYDEDVEWVMVNHPEIHPTARDIATLDIATLARNDAPLSEDERGVAGALVGDATLPDEGTRVPDTERTKPHPTAVDIATLRGSGSLTQAFDSWEVVTTSAPHPTAVDIATLRQDRSPGDQRDAAHAPGFATGPGGEPAEKSPPPDEGPLVLSVSRTKPHPTAVDIATLRRDEENELCPSEQTKTADATTTSSPTSRAMDGSAPTTADTSQTSRRLTNPVPQQPTQETEEGPLPLVPDADIDALRKAFSELDTAEQLFLSIVATQCKRAGYSLSMDANPPTKRRWVIGTALVHLARLGVGSDDTHEATVRALLGVVMGEEIQPAVVTGSAVARLTIDEAERLAVLAQAVGTSAHVALWGDGRVGLHGPAVEAARRVA